MNPTFVYSDMSWFKRKTEGITTSTQQKREAPDGLWHQCPECKKTYPTKELEANQWVCPSCDHHTRIGSAEYFEVIFDESSVVEHFANLTAADPLNFVDTKPYHSRLKETQRKTGLSDAMRVAKGTVEGNDFIVACMDFDFIGGSMGAVVGEKIARAAQLALKTRTPLMVISKSGGARMMEAAFSLMQMAKTSARLAELAEAGVPYLSLMTDPTTGGVTASFAMLGDLNLAEPQALIGFAGPRVIKETIKRDLPKGFQSAEMVLESGFLDKIVDRRKLRSTLAELLRMFKA